MMKSPVLYVLVTLAEIAGYIARTFYQPWPKDLIFKETVWNECPLLIGSRWHVNWFMRLVRTKMFGKLYKLERLDSYRGDKDWRLLNSRLDNSRRLPEEANRTRAFRWSAKIDCRPNTWRAHYSNYLNNIFCFSNDVFVSVHAYSVAVRDRGIKKV